MEEVRWIASASPASAHSVGIWTGVGVNGWETHEEEDVWDVELDFASFDPDSRASETDMTIGELMAWKYLRAEREKELVSELFLFKFLIWGVHATSIRATSHFVLAIIPQPSSTIG